MAMTEPLKDYTQRKILAEQLGITEKTLIRWELDGRGPPVTRIGRQVLYFKPSSPSSQAGRAGTGEPARKASSPFRVRPRDYPQDSGSVRGGSLVKRRRRSVRKRNRQRLAAHARRLGR